MEIGNMTIDTYDIVVLTMLILFFVSFSFAIKNTNYPDKYCIEEGFDNGIRIHKDKIECCSYVMCDNEWCEECKAFDTGE